jgi:hypothetical protein
MGKPMTPEELLAEARKCITPDDVKAIVESALIDAKASGTTASQARAFLKDVMFPKSMEAGDAGKIKKVVFKIMPPEVADEIRETAEAAAKPPEGDE